MRVGRPRLYDEKKKYSTVRIWVETADKLRELAKKRGQTMTVFLDNLMRDFPEGKDAL